MVSFIPLFTSSIGQSPRPIIRLQQWSLFDFKAPTFVDSSNDFSNDVYYDAACQIFKKRFRINKSSTFPLFLLVLFLDRVMQELGSQSYIIHRANIDVYWKRGKGL